MNSIMTKTSAALATALVVLVTTLPTDASAAGIRVKCEKQANRSKVSVDGRGLAAGEYYANIISGDNQKASLPVTGGGEIEFDFDSDKGDIAAGATAISPKFIQDGKVTGQIVEPSGHVVIEATNTCRTR